MHSYSSLWQKISTSNSFDARACKAFVTSFHKEGELSGKKCIEFLVDNLEVAIEKSLPILREDQCDNSLEEESKEKLKAYISKCFTTDRGIILLENHMMFFADAHTDHEKEVWFKETMEEWKNNLHSSLVEGFENALRLWMVSQ